MRSAFGLPDPNTTWVRPFASAHRVHEAVCSAYSRSAAARSTVSIGGQSTTRPGCASSAAASVAPASVGTAARAAAAAAARSRRTGIARLLRRAVHCERRELLEDVSGTTLRTHDRLVGAAHELVEVRLALHACVLVNGHAPSVLLQTVVSNAMARWRGTVLEGRIVRLEPLS